MIVDSDIANVICEIEYRISRHTYNPSSYNGWTGEVGCDYVYPVKYCKNQIDLKRRKISSSRHVESIDPQCINTMKLTFGANHLYVGDGIVDALKYLEERYHIDFNKLEAKRIKRVQKSYEKMKLKLDAGKIVRIKPGSYIVGVDIPVGQCIMWTSKSYYFDIIITDDKRRRVFPMNQEGERKIELVEGYKISSEYFPFFIKKAE